MLHKKIAEWIIEQDIPRKVNSEDIKEIGELIFGERLTSQDVVKVKYYLKKLGYFSESIEDSVKLTKKQKFWYAENLEDFIEPRVLKRNYIIKIHKKKRGNK